MKTKRSIHNKNRLCLIPIMLAAVMILSAACSTHTKQDSVYERVLRLHVIANSDSDDDQRIKYEVRDAILGATATLLGDCSDKEEAVERVNASRDVILDAAAEVLSQNGVDYGADMLVGQENYPERVYDGAAYPAGEYTSVRVVLGDGEGQNWWCVLFPPLCLSAALEKKAEATLPLSPADHQDGADDAVEVGITDKQYGIITETQSTPKYRLKFKLFELIAELFE